MAIRNVGIMMTRNEQDVIEEVMNAHAQYFEHIFVLDGSSDLTPSILRKYKCVEYLVHDKDIMPHGAVRDGARQFLIEEAQKRYGYEGYFSILHGDEIFHDDPNDVIEKAVQEHIEIIRWQMLLFFPHISEKDSFQHMRTLPIQQRMKWCVADWIEYRQFINKKGVQYDLEQHGSLLPHGINKLRGNIRFPVIKHYSLRTPDQIRARIKERSETGFADHAYMQQLKEKEDLFLDQIKEDQKAFECSKGIALYELGTQTLGSAYQEVLDKIKTLLYDYRNHDMIDDVIKKTCTQIVKDEVSCELLMNDVRKILTEP